jgi:rhamnogalacturonyl hydrolase YesR
VNYSNLSFADGMYSIAPFAALYGQIFNDGNLNLNSSLEQVEIIYEHCKNASTGLVVHGYDASRQTPWANPITGASPIVWSRSLAWYTIGIVDALEIAIKRPLSILTPQYERLLALFQQLAAAEIAAINKSVQLTGRHGIWQVVDMPGEAGNFVEASGSSMIAYALAKGARLGFIPKSNAVNAACGVFQDVVENFVVLNANGTLDYTGTSALCTLETPDVNYEVRLENFPVI